MGLAYNDGSQYSSTPCLYFWAVKMVANRVVSKTTNTGSSPVRPANLIQTPREIAAFVFLEDAMLRFKNAIRTIALALLVLIILSAWGYWVTVTDVRVRTWDGRTWICDRYSDHVGYDCTAEDNGQKVWYLPGVLGWPEYIPAR